MYGKFDSATQTWADGLASKIFRDFVNRSQEPFEFWTVFDGPVDTYWVENMNTVLDDSKILCLSNGERIKLHQKMRVLFETHDLSNCSPATVSRCGMIYIGLNTLNPMQLIEREFRQLDLSK